MAAAWKSFAYTCQEHAVQADIEQEMDVYGDLDPFAEEEDDWDPLARFTDGILPNVTNEDIEDLLQDPVARWVLVLAAPFSQLCRGM